ncbi:hypothetical protein KJI95_14995 [Shewanella sp. JM162201]|uniref:DUF1285 domain-containing protein n=1 Tax=Shewanella jiangmenensis TaxID=2837387 RepID=A0ABS5V7L8_9GAMM|nr:DUF1285 domain-containing protein [Shewanella jiangmenensis]MBT1445811.1 hypothetical protein [Shewanella jiangmenensis]
MTHKADSNSAQLVAEALTELGVSRNPNLGSNPSLHQDLKGRDEPKLCSPAPLFHIDADGHWHYQGSPLPDKFARLFITILRPEPAAIATEKALAKSMTSAPPELTNGHANDRQSAASDEPGWQLVTPFERVRVSVSLAPVIIVDVEPTDSGYLLTSVLGHEYTVPSAAIEPDDKGVRIHLPDGLLGAMSRSCYYRFAELLIDDQS